MEELFVFVVIEGAIGGIQSDPIDDIVPMGVSFARDIWDFVNYDIKVVDGAIW